eukprot:929584-Alexandrium_andersonii.AAC.1
MRTQVELTPKASTCNWTRAQLVGIRTSENPNSRGGRTCWGLHGTGLSAASAATAPSKALRRTGE